MSLYVATIAPTKARIITDGFAFKKGKLSHTDCRKVFELDGGCVLVHTGGWKTHAYAVWLSQINLNAGIPISPTGAAVTGMCPFDTYMHLLYHYSLAHPDPVPEKADGAFKLIGPRDRVFNTFYLAFAAEETSAELPKWENRRTAITHGLSLHADGAFRERQQLNARFQQIMALDSFEKAVPEMEKAFYEIRSEYPTIGGTTFIYDLSLTDGKVSIEKQTIPCDEPVNHEVCSESGLMYNRTLATALTSGQVDLSKAGVINKTLAHIADDAGSGRFARTSVHSSHYPTSNPLTATDAGASATVNIAAHTMQVGGTGVSNNS